MFVLPPVQVLVDVRDLCRGRGRAPHVTTAFCACPPSLLGCPSVPLPMSLATFYPRVLGPQTLVAPYCTGGSLNTRDLGPPPPGAFPDWNHQGCHRPHRFRSLPPFSSSEAMRCSSWQWRFRECGAGQLTGAYGRVSRGHRHSSESRNFPNSRWCRSKIEEPWKSLAKGFLGPTVWLRTSSGQRPQGSLCAQQPRKAAPAEAPGPWRPTAGWYRLLVPDGQCRGTGQQSPWPKASRSV